MPYVHCIDHMLDIHMPMITHNDRGWSSFKALSVKVIFVAISVDNDQFTARELYPIGGEEHASIADEEIAYTANSKCRAEETSAGHHRICI